ncbi:MAG: trigger factor [Thermodesulfovibrionales bacterium]|nr:trigger factor [Thermodesulfovibrionales bacterium]
MLKAVEDLSTTKKRLKIEIPSEAIEKKIKNSLEKARQKAKTPGFRPGKTPMNIIEKHFGKSAEAEALEEIIPEFYDSALKEAAIVPVTRPEIEGGVNFERNNPLSLSFTLEIRPKIENLKYEGIKTKDIPVTVSDEEVENALKRLQEGKATYEIADKEIEAGDLLTIDYEMKYDDQTTTAKDQVFVVGFTGLPKEISESLTGKKAGDIVEVEAQFPQDFHANAIAGKKVLIKNTVKAVKKKILPAIDAELAKDLGFENLDALKAGAREGIEKAKKEHTQKIQKNAILESLTGSHNFDIPESMLEGELTAMVHALKKSDKDEAALRDELKPDAIKNVRAMILLSIIGEKEGVNVTDEELKEKILDLSQQLAMTPESLIKIYAQRDGSLEGLRNNIHEQKVLDLLLSRAVIEKGE